jgi:hypothetical protein
MGDLTCAPANHRTSCLRACVERNIDVRHLLEIAEGEGYEL